MKTGEVRGVSTGKMLSRGKREEEEEEEEEEDVGIQKRKMIPL